MPTGENVFFEKFHGRSKNSIDRIVAFFDPWVGLTGKNPRQGFKRRWFY